MAKKSIQPSEPGLSVCDRKRATPPRFKRAGKGYRRAIKNCTKKKKTLKKTKMLRIRIVFWYLRLDSSSMDHIYICIYIY